jgi:MerR family transcriptional regulator, heat shock protein HspR
MEVPEDQGVFMISVAARLAGMHPQTLRIYEERGLIKPARSPKQTRLYSQRDVERLKRIQELTTNFGLNLAGVERVLALEETMLAMQQRLERLARRADQIEREMLARVDEVHRSYRRELVPWQPPGAALGLHDSAFQGPRGASRVGERVQQRVQHRAGPRRAR